MYRLCRGSCRCWRMRWPCEPVNEVVRRPGAGELHVALAHQGAGAGEFVLVALYALAVDQVRNVQQHLAVVHQSAAHLFVERLEEPMHLETDGACSRLPFACARGVLSQMGQIRAARSLRGQMPFDLPPAAIVDKDLQVHLRFTAEFVNVSEELPLIGADGFAKGFVVVKDGAKAEGKNRRMPVTVRDDAGVIDSRFLVE